VRARRGPCRAVWVDFAMKKYDMPLGADTADLVSDLIVVLGADGTVLHGNRAWHRLIDAGLQGSRAAKLHSLVHADDIKAVEGSLQAALHNHSSTELTMRIKCANDDVRVLSGRVHPLRPSSTVAPTEEAVLQLVLRDLTERRNADLRMRRDQAALQGILEAYPDIYFWLDENDATYRYHAGGALFTSPNQFLGCKPWEVLPTPVAEQFRRAVRQLRGRGTHTALRYRLPMHGAERCYEARLAPLPDDEILIIVRDVTERVADQTGAPRALADAHALTDMVTGLYTRDMLSAAFESARARAQREATTLALLLLDIDGLKRINDHGGQKAGDHELLRLACLLSACVRDGDVVARLGGGEFALLLVDGDAASASEVAERCRAVVERANEGLSGATVSVGFAAALAREATLDGMLLAAEYALDEAKRNGRNHVAMYRGALDDAVAID
jgi:diguanylate cyclase (GGDEF)-like protein